MFSQDRMKELKCTSKYISLLLRHKPEIAGISIDKHGWTDVENLLKNVNKTNYITFDELEFLVYGEDKKRYEFSADKKLIRAVHGHSIKVDLGYDPVKPPGVLYHGTAEKYRKSIEEKGLIPKSRQYVHLSMNIENAKEVWKRHGKLLLYKIDTKKMFEDGYKFYHSVSDIFLTEMVPFEYISEIEM